MSAHFPVCIRFSGLTFRFLFPNPIRLPEAFTALQCEDSETPDEEFEIRLLTEPLVPDAPLFCNQTGTHLYHTQEGWLRIYTPLIAENGCQVACLLRPNGKNVLYYPASRWDYFSDSLHCTHLIAGEALLLRHNAFLLHSSVVLHDGKIILFSGPSGAGKSTQAQLWETHLGAKVINGDRCVIMKKEDGFYGGGSLWSGTSGIYHPDQAPIAGIFLVNQNPENSLVPLGAAAFAPLFAQTTINSWDASFMESITDLMAELLSQVPVYRLNCRPDEDAVRLVHHTLF